MPEFPKSWIRMQGVFYVNIQQFYIIKFGINVP